MRKQRRAKFFICLAIVLAVICGSVIGGYFIIDRCLVPQYFAKYGINNLKELVDIASTIYSTPNESEFITNPFTKADKTSAENLMIEAGFPRLANGGLDYEKIGKGKYTLTPSEDFNQNYIFLTDRQSAGILNWGRGVWTYKNTWLWSSLAGKLEDGKMFGFNFGYGFGDTSNATENMIFLNGYTHKIDRVEFVIPKTKRGKDDFMRPWKITSGDGAVDLDFYPIIDRKACTDVLILKSDQHQVFGKFSGAVMAKNGKKVEVKNMLGFAEKVTNKW